MGGKRVVLFVSTGFLLMGCLPNVEKVVPDRVVQGDVIDLRDPRKGSLLARGTVHFGPLEAPVVLSWEPEDVYVEVPPGLTGEVRVSVEIYGLRSNLMEISILERDPLLRVMCFGDSIVYHGVPETLQALLDYHPYLNELEPVVLNQGKVSEFVSYAATRTRWSNALDFHDPDLAILLEATNDVGDNEYTSLENIRNSVIAMVDEAMLKGVDLVLCTLLPRVGACRDALSPTTEEYNAWLATYAHGRGISLVDLYHGFVSTPGWADLFFNDADCVHPNGNGHRKIAELLAEEIEDMYLASCTDLDGDGYGSPTAPSCDHFGRDCDDGDPNVHPADMEEACDNGLDDDCDGLVDGLDEDCMTGSCADPAEASVHAGTRVYGTSDLVGRLAFLLLPIWLALLWTSLRRKRQ